MSFNIYSAVVLGSISAFGGVFCNGKNTHNYSIFLHFMVSNSLFRTKNNAVEQKANLSLARAHYDQDHSTKIFLNKKKNT